ncbi:MAG: hypothetical protein LBG76_02715 [Treponema sp.]|jgi:hypothetical protein|nr:hypothetical protein [Treponema sp.]
MSKKKRMVVALAAMTLAGIGLVPNTAVYAESNRSLSTAGRFGTDVDDFIGVSTWSGVLGGEQPKSFFAYTRLGQGTLNGNLELGIATRLGEALYLGAFYNGWFQADKAETVGVKGEKITLYEETRSGKPLTLEALVGIGGMGIKLGYNDTLKIENSGAGNNTYNGSIKPYVGIGFDSGTFSELRFTLNFNRDESVAGGGVSGRALKALGEDPYDQESPNFDDFGSYIEPQLYIDLNLGLGGLELENDLALRLYTNGATDADGKAWSAVKGLAITWDYAAKTAIMDEKFYLSDTVTPSYTLTGAALNDTVGWKVKFSLPITIGLDTDKLSALSGTSTTKSAEISTFMFGLAPTLATGVFWKPFPLIDVHAGVEINVFDWDAKALSTKTPPDNKKVEGNDSTFTGPVMTLGLGTTLSLGPLGLDIVLLKGARPTIDGTIYEAISGGLNTSFVLSAKF